MKNLSTGTPERFPLLFALFALLVGAGCGALHVFVAWMDQPDPLLSALAVTVATMLLGLLRPKRPWRWVLLVGAPVPLTILIASIAIPAVHFTKASVAGSILIVLPGFAGAYGGSVLRHKIWQIFYEEEPAPPQHANGVPSGPAVGSLGQNNERAGNPETAQPNRP